MGSRCRRPVEASRVLFGGREYGRRPRTWGPRYGWLDPDFGACPVLSLWGLVGLLEACGLELLVAAQDRGGLGADLAMSWTIRCCASSVWGPAGISRADSRVSARRRCSACTRLGENEL